MNKSGPMLPGDQAEVRNPLSNIVVSYRKELNGGGGGREQTWGTSLRMGWLCNNHGKALLSKNERNDPSTFCLGIKSELKSRKQN